MTEEELFNEYRKSNCKSFSDFLINKIAELETENERITVSYETLKLHDEEEIGILKSENAELDCQKSRNKFCYSCANATERCFRNEIGCPCEKYKSYKDENAELKEYNKYLKRKRQGGIQKQYNKVTIIKQQDDQLTKAKDLIELLLSDNRIMKAQFESEEQANIWFEHIHQAEQFLKETE